MLFRSTPKARQARISAATNHLPALRAKATALAKQAAEAEGPARKALDIELGRVQDEIKRLQNQIASDQRALAPGAELPVPDLLGPISSKKEGDGTVQGLNGQWATPEEDVTLADALGRVNWAKFGPLFSVLKERMLQEIRGVQVHIVSPEDMFRLNGRDRALGLYEYSADKGENIFIRSDLDQNERIEAFMHEAGHALVMRVMRKDPAAHAAVQRIARAVQNYYARRGVDLAREAPFADRKSTRLNSSHT